MKLYKLSGMALATVLVVFAANAAMADTFGTGATQFTIDFVPISCATNPSRGILSEDSYFTFTGVNHAYRMGTYEITNDEWNKFKTVYGTVMGNPSYAYDSSTPDTGTNVPANYVSWYEAAQFVNWLNTSTGNQAAYKFTGTQGTSNYTFAAWSTTDTGYNADNPYRNKNAFYYLPTENEWVKAAYWNGTTLQNYATKAGQTLFQGNGTNGGWNYYLDGDYGPDGDVSGTWNVGSGSQKLNGTYDMMGNVWEWMENPYSDANYGFNTKRAMRGSSYGSYSYMAASTRIANYPTADDFNDVGFRVASVPEFMPGDANKDGTVNVADLTLLLNNYNKTGMVWADGDFTTDGIVNVADLTALLNNYNQTSGLSMGTPVPEPSGIAMLGIGAFSLLCWKRKQA